MPITKKEELKEEKHIHTWRQSFLATEMKCDCGKIMISSLEAQKREAEWNAYFELVRTTESFREFMETKTASKERVIEIGEKALERIKNNDYLPKPPYPDPVGESWRYYIPN